ncbi:MAG: M56 family metallopeptidase, partial [Planctomycetota bacterium]|nr:M56 family metallopeptidase [Planctomycetota bacterium]
MVLVPEGAIEEDQRSGDTTIVGPATVSQPIDTQPTAPPLEERPQIAAPIPVPLAVESATPPGKPLWNFDRVFVGCWLVGTLVGGILFLFGVIQQKRRLSRLQRLEVREWTASVTAAARTLGLNQPIVTLECDEDCVPSVVGIVTPRLLIPQNWRLWSPAQRRCILLHELAHVKRRDVFAQLLGRVALAVYWFHPLAWLAVRQMRVERELAADDCVLLAGQTPSDYADQLLRTLRLYRPVTPEMGVAMAHSCRLDQRVLAILDPGRRRGPVSRPLSVLSACTVGLLAGLLGTTSIAPRLAIATMPVDSSDDSSSDQPVEPIADPPKKPLSVISAVNVAD